MAVGKLRRASPRGWTLRAGRALGCAVVAAALAGGTPVPGLAHGGSCMAPADPDYYRIPLVSTRTVSGTGQSTGQAGLVFPAESAFGVALAPDGSYRYRVRFAVDRLPARAPGTFVAWVTTPQLDRIHRIGPLDAEGRVEGDVEWNKFLVVVTLEPADAPTAGPADPGGEGPTGALDAPGGVETSTPPWTGPVVLRGMSRSGRMHTMAGHGPFEQERCAQYGY